MFMSYLFFCFLVFFVTLCVNKYVSVRGRKERTGGQGKRERKREKGEEKRGREREGGREGGNS